MPDPVRPVRSMFFRGRSYIAFVLTPEAPDYVSRREELHRLADTYPEALPG